MCPSQQDKPTPSLFYSRLGIQEELSKDPHFPSHLKVKPQVSSSLLNRQCVWLPLHTLITLFQEGATINSVGKSLGVYLQEIHTTCRADLNRMEIFNAMASLECS